MSTSDAGVELLRSLVAATRACAKTPASASSGLSEAQTSAVRRIAGLLRTISSQALVPGLSKAVEAVADEGKLRPDMLSEASVEALADAVDALVERTDTSLDRARGIRHVTMSAVMRGGLGAEDSGAEAAGKSDSGLPRWSDLVAAEERAAPSLPGDMSPLRVQPAEGAAPTVLTGPQRVGRRHPRANDRARHFRPLLRSKPNALPEAPLATSPAADGSWPHPYAAELAALDWATAFPWFLRRSTPGDFRPAAPATWVDTPAAVAAMAEHLGEQRVQSVAIDVEAHNEHSFQGLTCLIQVSTRWQDFLVDPLALGPEELAPLNAVFTDPAVLKLLHGCDRDVVWLQRCCGIYLVGVFDTGQAARVLDLPSAGLAYLLRTMAGVEADKSLQRADWRRRPLPPAMLGYAAEDTRFLVPIADRLRNRLLDQGGEAAVMEVLDRSRKLCAQTYTIPAFRPGAGARDLAARAGLKLDDAQGRALDALSDWRDLVARATDEAPHTILPKRALLRIAEAAPVTLAGLAAACHPLPPAVHVRAAAVCRLIAMAREGKAGTAWTRAADGSQSSSSSSSSAAGAGAGAAAQAAAAAAAHMEAVQPTATAASLREALALVGVAGTLAQDAGVLRLPALPRDTQVDGAALAAARQLSTPPSSASAASSRAPSGSASGAAGSPRCPAMGLALRGVGSAASRKGQASRAALAVRDRLARTPHLTAAGVPLHLLVGLAEAAARAQEAAAAVLKAEQEAKAAAAAKAEAGEAAADDLPATLAQRHPSEQRRAKKQPRDEAGEGAGSDAEQESAGSAAKRARTEERAAVLAHAMDATAADAAIAGASGEGSMSARALVGTVSNAARAITSRNSAFQRAEKVRSERKGVSTNPFLRDGGGGRGRGRGRGRGGGGRGGSRGRGGGRGGSRGAE
ncbi:hypothetical protein FNF29_07919 [Cafeteria roenbergensis]|uniref:HRDC domain-containing protein n=1 Tax=Cafeteria roenbergensis TaxID=33653 RepID=A0A5A8C224_CAFRO|nr:hypothetical protein FNF29_07919 [Cafeteria roenbergensis]|eukprot:KAA0146677.1 hypothetical protein FNF29_07919 [Cafeteria roenbergensis]